MDKENVRYKRDRYRDMYNGNYSAIKKNEILPFAITWMNLEDIMLSEISQSQKGKYYMIPLV